jgi:hypothetical protein
MSVAMTVPNGVRIMQTNPRSTNNLSPAELQEVVRKIHALRRVSKTTGFNTLNTIVELLRPLSMEDLIAVGEELKFKPNEKARLSEVGKAF